MNVNNTKRILWKGVLLWYVIMVILTVVEISFLQQAHEPLEKMTSEGKVYFYSSIDWVRNTNIYWLDSKIKNSIEPLLITIKATTLLTIFLLVTAVRQRKKGGMPFSFWGVFLLLNLFTALFITVLTFPYFFIVGKMFTQYFTSLIFPILFVVNFLVSYLVSIRFSSNESSTYKATKA